MLRPGVDAFASPALHILRPPAATSHSAASGTGRVARDENLVPGGSSRLLAAHLLERSLLRIGRAGTLVDRRLAPALQRLRSRRLYRLLGYVRLGDYLTERLGMSLRRCQSILRLGRVVDSLPGLGRALQAGELSLSKVESIAGIATPATEDLWIERARHLPVAALREATRAESAAADTSSEPTTPSDSVAPVVEERIEQDEPGRFVSFDAPASVVGVWHWTLDLVRRVAGRQEPAWRCAEYLAAEFLSGVPGSEAPESPPSETPTATTRTGSIRSPIGDSSTIPGEAIPSPRAPSSDAATRSASGPSALAAWTEACDAVREALGSIGAAADIDTILSEPPGVDGQDEPDAWESDVRLRRLVRLRQSLAWRQGRLLATFAAFRLNRELGFVSLDDWIDDRLPMSPRRARYLISLDRRLRDLPQLGDAYRRGLVSWSQARLLVRVVARNTQSRWIRYARQVTVRRLEDVVIRCEVESAGTAHVGASPLPPVEPGSGQVDCAPAASPLHTSAPDHPGSAPGPAPLHISAPASWVDGMLRPPAVPRHAWRRISFWAPLDVAALWDGALRACRSAAGMRLDDWECYLLFVKALRETWDNPDDPQWKRRHRIFERDGWRCKAPGCTSRSSLNEHHVIFRSQQGSDDDGNLVTLCVGHHQEGVHASRVRCFGRAPDALWWDLGVNPGGDPLVRYFGERVVTARPRVPLPARPQARAG